MKTLSVNYYFYILERLESLGLSRSKVSDIVPFDMKEKTQPADRIEIDSLHQLLKIAQSELSIPHIGLKVSKSFRISNYGYAGSIFSTCGTLSDALVRAEKYGCLAHTLGRFRLDQSQNADPKWAKFIWEPSFGPSDDEKFRQITECVLSNYALTIKWLSWSFEGGVNKVTFRHAAKLPISEYENVLGCEVEFEAKRNGFFVDRSFLNMPIPTANPLKLSILEQKLNRLLAEYNQESDLLGRLKYSLKKKIQTERPSFASIAEDLALTERSLKRYLGKQNIRFKDVVRDVKMELCEIYLRQGVPYAEIAQLLWYADQSAFTRAYKNWYGTSPSKHMR
ncbi:MAG: AraC family transcriptional regulator ligand-binding domain-containing protein [Litorimonas sp.]